MAYTGTAAERLTAVREAIDKCLSSQAYTIRGRSQQMAQLATLRQMEKELEQEVEAGDGGMAVNYASRMRPV